MKAKIDAEFDSQENISGPDGNIGAQSTSSIK